jgi:sugar phosphate isomerase/epimerase
MQAMNPIGIELISVFGLGPVDFVHVAADLGVQHISTGLMQGPINPEGYPPFSLVEDKPLRRAMIDAMRERGISISLGEGMTVREGLDVRTRAPELDIMAELGVTRINTVSLDPDLSRTFDTFAAMAEMAAERGMETTTEFAPGLTVADLPTALRAVAHVARPDFRLLIDTMHFSRTGSTPADLATIDTDLIAYVQLCDAPLAMDPATYMQESMTERLPPGAGELPLREILALVPRDRVVALEIPQLSLAKAGLDARARLAPVVAAAQAMLAAL